MIAKEFEQPSGILDKNERAGAKAERTLAHYLKRKFGDTKDVFVFSGLRLQDGDDAAQIDHLVMHRHGFVIIESKSVTKRVRVDGRGHWCRWVEGDWQGMSSPVQQARRQADFLKAFLTKNKDILRDNVMFLNRAANFSIAAFDVLVAISDAGILEGEVPEVFKADFIPDQVEQIIKRHKRGAALISLKDGLDKITNREQVRICDFLNRSHAPLVLSPKSPAPSTSQPNRASNGIACKHCGSNELAVVPGRYSYYYKCSSCGGNTTIDFTCTKCARKGKIRKEKLSFYRECSACGTSELVYVNPEPSGAQELMARTGKYGNS